MSSQNVLITGASGGVGTAIANSFAERGAHVTLCARSETELSETADSVRKRGGRATIAPIDVRDENQISAMFTDIAPNQIDIMFAAAGISGSPPGEAPLPMESYDEFDNIMKTNVRGLFATLREGIESMPKNGRIIVPSGKVARKPISGMGAYAVSKAGAEGIVRGFAADAEQVVGIVYPGFVATELTHGKGLEPSSVSDLFVWAATECPKNKLNGSVVTLNDWKSD